VRIRFARLPVIVALILGAVSLGFGITDRTQAATRIAACAALAAAVLCARRAQSTAARVGRPWNLLASGTLTYAIGTVALAAPHSVPAWVANAARLSGVALLIAGIIALQPARARTHPSLRTLLDALTVGSALALTSWALPLHDLLHTSSSALIERVVGLAYPAAAGALLASAVFVALKRRIRGQVPVLLTAGGAALLAGADTFAILLAANRLAEDNVLFSLARAAAFALIALGSVNPNREFESSLLNESPETGVGTMLPPVTAILAVGLAGVVVVSHLDLVVYLTGVLLVVLLLARQLLSLRDRLALENRLVYQALHDPLTRLGNRILFQDRLDHALIRRRRGSEGLAVVFLDIDDFKVINDTLGHAAGDQVLIAVADRLRGCLRTEDTIARFGGDEFAVLLEGIPAPEKAGEVAGRILTALDEPFVLRGRQIQARASIGVAIARHNQTRDSILRDADVAMYAAKRMGKGRYETYERSYGDTAGQLDLLTDLHQSVASGLQDMALVYEPIVDMRTRAIVGVRPRLCWHHARRGVLSHEDFLPLAEQGGLGEKLSVWTLSTAVADARVWRERMGADSPAVWAATSTRHLVHAGLINEISQALDTGPLSPKDLILEIRESELGRSSEASRAMLAEMHSRGVRIAIAEFGTGGLGLQALESVPSDILVIGSSLVDRIDRGAEASALPRGIIKLAATLGAIVVADGVAREEQRNNLVALGCLLGQGRLFPSAVDADAIAAMIGGSIESNMAG